MYKKLLSLLLIAVMLLSGGCDLPSLLEGGNSATVQKVDENKYKSDYANNRQYCHLDKDSQQRYGSLYTALTDGFATDEQVIIGSTTVSGIRIPLAVPMTDQKQAELLYTAFFRDNPQFFYVGGAYELEGYMKDDTPCYDTLVLMYTMDAAARQAAQRELESAVQNIFSRIPNTKDEYEIELFLHDQIALGCTYSDQAAAAGFDAFPNAFNAYGALVEGQAVCEGYSRALQLLLKRQGISCALVTGISLENNEQHMWNLVRINGQDYYVDPTWNDSDDLLCHTFFNITSRQLALTHALSDEQTNIDCTATADNYFIRQKAYIDVYDRDAIARAIAVGFTNGQSTIELRFAPDKYDNGLLFLKNQRMTQSMTAKYIASGEPLWNYELMTDAACYMIALVKKQ